MHIQNEHLIDYGSSYIHEWHHLCTCFCHWTAAMLVFSLKEYSRTARRRYLFVNASTNSNVVNSQTAELLQSKQNTTGCQAVTGDWHQHTHARTSTYPTTHTHLHTHTNTLIYMHTSAQMETLTYIRWISTLSINQIHPQAIGRLELTAEFISPKYHALELLTRDFVLVKQAYLCSHTST